MNRRGFGCMRIRDSAIVRRAVELGFGFLDTADVYGHGESERLIGQAFDSWPEEVSRGTKGGLNCKSTERFHDGRPGYLRQVLDASLLRLGRDHVELYTLHRHDPEVPIEESVGAIDELRRAGKCLAEVRWLLDRSPVIVPIPGTSSVEHLEELVC